MIKVNSHVQEVLGAGPGITVVDSHVQDVLTSGSQPTPEMNVNVRSQRSTRVFHSTLFEAFGLGATAYYNFFEPDELTNTQQDESAHVNNIARYVELSWFRAPVGAADLQRVPSKGVRPDLKETTSPIMGVQSAAGSVANGFVSPGTISALIADPVTMAAPTASFHEDSFLLSDDAAGLDAIATLISRPAAFVFMQPTPPTPRARVTFIDPSIAGVLDPGRVEVAQTQQHLTSLGTFAALSPALEVLSEFNQDVPPVNPPPQFPAPAESPTLIYVGYLIEKYQLGENGSMDLVKTFYVDDPYQRSLIDREVVFNGQYTYRMRVVVQWTHPTDVGFAGQSDLIKERAFDPSASTKSKVASFYVGDWSEWANAEIRDNRLPDPPDELTVRPISHRGEIDIVWKMPPDPQRDIKSVRLLRAIDVNGAVGPWMQLGEFPSANGRYLDRDVSPWETTSQSYIYAMYSVSLHDETSPLTEQIECRIRVPARGKEELPLRQVADRGGDPFGSSTAHRPILRDKAVVGKRRVAFYIRPNPSDYPLFDRTYLVEFQSLSTGEKIRTELQVDSTDVGLDPSAPRTGVDSTLGLDNRREVVRRGL